MFGQLFSADSVRFAFFPLTLKDKRMHAAVEQQRSREKNQRVKRIFGSQILSRRFSCVSSACNTDLLVVSKRIDKIQKEKEETNSIQRKRHGMERKIRRNLNITKLLVMGNNLVVKNTKSGNRNEKNKVFHFECVCA